MWCRIGWQGRETVSDSSWGHNYCQRTRGNRLTIGGWGDPYRYGSGTDAKGEIRQATIDRLIRDFHRMFPQAAGARIDHAWGGVFGVPRDWCASVGFDPAAGFAWAAAMSARALPHRTLRAERCVISFLAMPPSSPLSLGSTGGALSGNRSLCAGSPSDPCVHSTLWPIRRSVTARRRSRGTLALRPG